jgi:hypothetical protein
MRFSRNLIKTFLVLFLLVVLANIIAPFFHAWNFYLGGTLLIFVIISAVLYLRKTNPKVAKYTLITSGSILLALLLVGLVFVTVNFFYNNQVSYKFDIGGPQDMNKSYLYPSERVSQADANNSYRNITSRLVYLDVPAKYDSGIINFSFSIQENLPFGSTILVRAKNSSDWNFTEQLVYVSINNIPNYSSWKTVSVQFNASDLFISNQTFTFCIDAPHLSEAKTRKDYFAIDWINVVESK